MGRRKNSDAAVIVALITGAIFVLVAVIKAIFAIVRWIYTQIQTSKATPNSKPQLAESTSGVRLEIRTSSGGDYDRYFSGKSLEKDSKKFWKLKFENAAVGGQSLSLGLTYFGTGLGSLDSQYDPEPSLLDPKLSFLISEGEEVEPPGYWPRYDRLNEAQRGEYIKWLQSERATEVDLGYVFIFFYGLERRVVELSKTSNSSVKGEELGMLRLELERLRSIYGTTGSFGGYSGSLLELIELINCDFNPTQESIARMGDAQAELVLARLLNQKAQVSPEEILLYWKTSNRKFFKGPIFKNCQEEYLTLMGSLIQKKYPEGCKVEMTKSPFSFSYRPASPGIPQTAIGIPGVFKLGTAARLDTSLQKMAVEVDSELSKFSRFQKKSSAGGEVDARQRLLHLPEKIFNTEVKSASPELAALLEDIQSSQQVQIKAKKLSEMIGYGGEDFGKTEYRQVCSMFARLGYSTVPDGTLDHIPFVPEEDEFVTVVGKPRKMEKLEPNVQKIIFVAEVLVSVALDDKDCASYGPKIFELVTREEKLTKADAVYVTQLIDWMLKNPRSFGKSKRNLSALSDQEKQYIKLAAISVAQLDGEIANSQMKLLERLYKRLGYEPSELFRNVHEMTGVQEAPRTVKPKGQGASDYTIPKSMDQAKATEGVSLNMDLLAKKLHDSKKASDLLRDIFKEEEEPAQQANPAATQASIVVPEKIIAALHGRKEVSQSEFAVICSEHNCPPSAAMEIVNDLYFEKYGFALLEGESLISINWAKENGVA